MKRFIISLQFLLVCVGLLIVAACSNVSGADAPNSPNFLFIFVDDQSWSVTSVAMMPGKDFSRTPAFHMPNLERIAAQGMIFSQAYASHPKCECSRAALLMGRSTTSLNAVEKSARNWNAPPSDSLANTLKRANASYGAAHFGKWQWPQTPESMGYDASDGITMNTYIIYMSDNGGGTQVLKGGKALVDEGGLRVPLIVNGPSVQSGTYCDEPAVGYDILSTVLDFAVPGFVLPNGVEGGSWKTVLMNAGTGKIQRPIDRLVFHHDVDVPHPQTAMLKGNLKLLHYWDTKESFLYELSIDLSEQNNLAAAKPAVVAK